MRAAQCLCLALLFVVARARPGFEVVDAVDSAASSARRSLLQTQCPEQCPGDCLVCYNPDEGCVPVPDGQGCTGNARCLAGICVPNGQGGGGGPAPSVPCPAVCPECTQCTNGAQGCVNVPNGNSCGVGSGRCINGLCTAWGTGPATCPANCGDCQVCSDPNRGCEAVADGRSCGLNGAGTCIAGGVCAINRPSVCPAVCPECKECTDGAKGCVNVPDGRTCGAGSGACVNGLCTAGAAPQCPGTCGDCKSCVDPARGCEPVSDGRSCAGGKGSCRAGGVCSASATSTCPPTCEECKECRDGAAGCVAVRDGRLCGNGSGSCTAGMCVAKAAPSCPSCPECNSCSDPEVGCVPVEKGTSCGKGGKCADGVCVTGSSSPGTVTPQASPPAPPPEVVPDNALCSNPAEGITGAFAPVNPNSVPDGVPELVAKEFLASNATFNGEEFVGCDTYNTSVLLGCSQVVAGMNYHILVDISCRDPVSGTDTWESIRTWDNGVKAAWVEADVSMPLPGSGDMEVTSLALKVVRLPPSQNTSECPATGNSTSGYYPFDWKAVPKDVTKMIGNAAVDAGLAAVTNTSCSEVALTPQPSPCSEDLEATYNEGLNVKTVGVGYWLGIDLTCVDGTFNDGSTQVGVGITVHDLVSPDEPPELWNVELQPVI